MPDSPEHCTDGTTDGAAHYTDGTTDLLGDALDEISQCLKNAAPLPAGATAAAMQAQHDQLLALRDVYGPALLAVVAGALELTHTWETEAARSDRLAQVRDHEDDVHAAGLLLSVRAQAYQDLAGTLRAAVSRALLGEDGTGG
jgi:hypothetical protein